MLHVQDVSGYAKSFSLAEHVARIGRLGDIARQCRQLTEGCRSGDT